MKTQLQIIIKEAEKMRVQLLHANSPLMNSVDELLKACKLFLRDIK